jgi:hypothetical protein
LFPDILDLLLFDQFFRQEIVERVIDGICVFDVPQEVDQEAIVLLAQNSRGFPELFRDLLVFIVLFRLEEGC